MLLQRVRIDYATTMRLASVETLLLGEKDKPNLRLLVPKKEDPDHQERGHKLNALQLQLTWITNGDPR